MNEIEPLHWPPLISHRRAPWPLRVRDAVLTALAWFLLIWVLRDALLALIAGISPEAAARTAAWVESRLSPLLGELLPIAPAAFWEQFNDFLGAAGLLVAWLAVWAWLNRKSLQRQPRDVGLVLAATDEAPAALSAQIHFTSAGATQLPSLWWQSRRLHAQFDASGKLLQAVADDDAHGSG